MIDVTVIPLCLLVAERAPEPDRADWAGLASFDPRLWLVNSRVLGAFKSGGGTARLAEAGLSVAPGCSLNLLPPALPESRGGEPWDAALARSVGDELRGMLADAWDRESGLCDLGPRESHQRGTWRYARLVLAGRRVAAALGLGDLPLWSWRGGAFLAPHPSGLSKAWNELDCGWARARVAAWLAGETCDTDTTSEE